MVNLKGGTIRSIVKDFLENYDNPKHISDVSDYVIKFRPNTNSKSIYYNLKIDESQTFVFYKNSYIGLKNKKYNDDYLFLDVAKKNIRKSWNERYEDLRKFIETYKKLPFYNSSNYEEKSLFTWLNNQKHSSKLSYNQKLLINNILENNDRKK